MKNIDVSNKELLASAEVAEHIYQIQTRGYSELPDFLSKEEVNILRTSMECAISEFKPIEGVERSFLDRYQIHDLINRDINYGRLLEDPRLQQLIAPHLGEHWIMYAATSSSIPPHGSNYSSRLHVDCPRFHPGYIFNMGLIWVLDDYTFDNGGALKILPGSQHSDINPGLDFFEKHCIQVDCKAGSLLLFNARIYHRTFENTTDHWNHSMTLNACRSFMKPRMDWVRFIPNEISCQLNAQARRLIGFDTRLPTNLEEFFLPEEQRLYKANQG
ncbi:phytanoyl-CoA dioxygenase family protein [Methylomonas sp. MO1]|uniref:phytanoyl-CoA dioxygenase family protein n=1 Tax=unclassified Methylomonas TaxID=2608980 RepID=UPI00047D6C10|nr:MULTISPECIES: phytanoyl-CoA dioxygenase family protein [unclassified Methylomonas]MDT4291147.1 phytanoyl-CoA dioxygenase family protein [Methylomonas sp. MO1]